MVHYERVIIYSSSSLHFASFRAVFSPISSGKMPQIMRPFAANHFTFHYQQHHYLQLTPKQLPPFPRLTTPLPLRGGAGGEALFALYYFPFYFQPRHPHNCFILQLRWYCAIIPMDEFRNINALMVQLGTSCSFDSPGLARNEPTPGQRSQGDSTPSVLSFFCEGTLTMKHFMADYSKKAQHLRRCSPHHIP